ncbi:MAG: sensor histidine kinase, partial [Gemmatimonadaceae bacterium]
PTRLIEVRATEPVTCRCDPELLRRIIENLVSNAMKHTSSGGKISVDVSATGGGARIAVQDEGPGVPAEARDRIFERFSAPALRTESGYHSVGLGLAFCNLAVEAHGGTIRVVDGNPRGSVFVVDLPDR